MITVAKKWASVWIALIGIAATAQAQASMSVVEKILEAGQSADIEYSDPGQANQTIYIEISNGSVLNPASETVTIQLDGNGKGSAKWPVPESGWDTAYFNNPRANEVARLIKNSQDG